MPVSTSYRSKNSAGGEYAASRRNGAYSGKRVDSYKSGTYLGGRLYNNTSTAYEIPAAYPKREVKPKPPAVPARKGAAVGNRSARSMARVALTAFVIFALCCTVIYRYAVILENNQKIIELEKNLNAAAADNQAMRASIDRRLEMGEIEKYAREELGMMKPENYQIFYIDMNMEDSGSRGSAANETAGALSGAPGALVNAFRVLK